ncbi:MAG: ornithine cyclodeaminase family protein [Saprospiraceae bacterium]|nr:ornithine cyclodeaminase family protein [Saprospiraceae bacterium]MBL0024280.1 ornithine cyclodeaminase family protein [Saprospiraceae bacterium]
MPSIINLDEIKSLMGSLDVVAAIEEGFIQYSNGNSVVPPVGELIFEKPPGDVHIKYGYIKDDDYYVIKIASGFYDNPKIGLPSGQGLMLLFNQKTGALVSILLDEGYLTNIRTAAAGALAARYFAPKKLEGIGVLGTGIQAELQLKYLLKDHTCENIWIWGRDRNKAEKLKSVFGENLNIHIAIDPAEVALHCNIIITTTPSTIPLLSAHDIRPGTHITAVGSDTSDKQELDGNILAKADIVISDSIPQSKSRGEIYQAVKANLISEEKILELGYVIQNPGYQRNNDDQITVADLTGVAVQDIMIAKAVYNNYNKKR